MGTSREYGSKKGAHLFVESLFCIHLWRLAWAAELKYPFSVHLQATHNCNSTTWLAIAINDLYVSFLSLTTLSLVPLPPHPRSSSYHRFPVQSDGGRPVGHLPSACRRQLRPGLLFHGVPREPHGVPGPGDVQRRGGQNLDHWPPLPDGRHQRWRLAGQTPAHTWPISLSASLCEVQCLEICLYGSRSDFFSVGPLHTNGSLTCWTWLKQTFEEADKNGDGLLNIDEIYQLLHKLNVNLPRRKVKQMFQVRNEVTVTCLADDSFLPNYFDWVFELQPHRHHTFVIF